MNQTIRLRRAGSIEAVILIAIAALPPDIGDYLQNFGLWAESMDDRGCLLYLLNRKRMAQDHQIELLCAKNLRSLYSIAADNARTRSPQNCGPCPEQSKVVPYQ